MTKRGAALRYSSTDKARGIAALAEHNGNLSKAARAAGVPRKTLDYWARSTGVRSGDRRGTADDVEQVKAKWGRARDINLDEMQDPEKVKRASLKENIWAAGTAQDKLQILSGKPTGMLAFGDLATFLRSAETPALGDGSTIEGEVIKVS